MTPEKKDILLTEKVGKLAAQLHAAVKEWAHHIDPTITEAYVFGNVFEKERLSVTRTINQLPEWAKQIDLMNQKALSTPDPQK